MLVRHLPFREPLHLESATAGPAKWPAGLQAQTSLWPAGLPAQKSLWPAGLPAQNSRRSTRLARSRCCMHMLHRQGCPCAHVMLGECGFCVLPWIVSLDLSCCLVLQRKTKAAVVACSSAECRAHSFGFDSLSVLLISSFCLPPHQFFLNVL
jgi:hypothetical protein